MLDYAFWTSARGDSPVEEYLLALPRVARASFRQRLDLVLEFGPAAGMPITRSIVGVTGLWELRFGGSYRVAYEIQAGTIVLLHAWRKRRQQTERRDIMTARRRMGQ